MPAKPAAIVSLARRQASETDGTFVVDDAGRPIRSMVLDGWANSLTGLGMAQRDKRLAAVFQRSRLLGQPELDALFAGDWLIARAAERPADDQVRRWVDVKVDGKKGSDDDIANAMHVIGAEAALQEAITWARLHGGALIILGIDDGGAPEEPVNLAQVRGIQWLNVIDRWDATVYRYYSALGQTHYGVPEIYQLATTIVSAGGDMLGGRFHETRCLRVDGVRTSRRARLENAGWNHGIVQRLYDVVRDFHAAIAGTAHLTTDFSQPVLKITGLAKILAEDKDNLLRTRLLALDLARSLARIVPIDGEESFERVTASVAGLPELLDRLRDAVCGAVDMPEKILFGKATTGMGDQGQSDLEQYYNQIAGEQQRNVVPQLTRLATYLYAANGGVPKRWRICPKPLWEPSENELSENRQRDAQTDSLNIASGIYSSDEARRSRFGGDGYGRDIVLEDDEEVDGVASADPEDAGPAEVQEVTGVVINAAAQAVKDFIAGDLTEAAARVLVTSALHLSPQDLDAMFEGADEARAEKKVATETQAKAEAEQLAARVQGGGPPKPGVPPAPPKKPPPTE